jgi:uncharacterized protein DUF4386
VHAAPLGDDVTVGRNANSAVSALLPAVCSPAVTPAPAQQWSELDHASTLGWFAIISAVLSTLVTIGLLQPMPPSPAALLLHFAEHRLLVAVEAVVVLTWAVFSVPFVVALGQLARARSASLALSAPILSAIGILLLAYGIRNYISAMMSIAAAGHALDAADTLYQAAIWRSLFFFLADPGLMTWGLGQFLFGTLAWKSTVFPNWVAAVGMLGGLAGLLTDAVYQTGALALLQIACFAIWGFVTGAMLLTRRA